MGVKGGGGSGGKVAGRQAGAGGGSKGMGRWGGRQCGAWWWVAVVAGREGWGQEGRKGRQKVCSVVGVCRGGSSSNRGGEQAGEEPM